MTASWDDEKLAAAVAEFGIEIYGVWWRILEIIGKQMDGTPKTYCQYSPKTWAKFCGISVKKFQKFENILSKKNLIISKKLNNETLIDVPNMAKYRDEFSSKELRKSRVSPD